MSSPRVLAVVPARGGSKGLPGKNSRLLAGLPLVAHSLRAAAAMRTVTRCVVSTDDPEIARVAREHGGDVPWLRPAELATDTTPMAPVLRHALAAVEEEEGRPYDALVLLDPTSPARVPAEVDAAVEQLLRRPDLDGVISVSEPSFNPVWVGVRPSSRRARGARALLPRGRRSHAPTGRRPVPADQRHLLRVDLGVRPPPGVLVVRRGPPRDGRDPRVAGLRHRLPRGVRGPRGGGRTRAGRPPVARPRPVRPGPDDRSRGTMCPVLRADLERTRDAQWDQLRSYLLAYAARQPVERVAVVGNAPLHPDAVRAATIDAADLVIRVKRVRPRRARRGADGRHRVPRGAPLPCHDVHPVDAARPPGARIPRPPGRLRAVPARRRDRPPPARRVLARRPRRDAAAQRRREGARGAGPRPRRPSPGSIIPTAGTTALFLAHEMFPGADLVGTGFSFLDDEEQTSWSHHSGGHTRVNWRHRLDLEATLLRSWIADGTLRHLS